MKLRVGLLGVLGAVLLFGGVLYFASVKYFGVASSVAVIGGAYGPTAIFVAGKVGQNGLIGLILPILVAGIVAIGFLTWLNNKKNK